MFGERFFQIPSSHIQLNSNHPDLWLKRQRFLCDVRATSCLFHRRLFFASHRNLHNFIIEYFLRVNRCKSDVSQSTIQFSQVVYLRSRWDRSINKPWIHQLRAIKQIYLAWHVFINIKSWKRTARRHSVSTKKKKSFRAEQDEDGKKQFVCTKEAAEAASSTFFLSLIFHPRQCLA